MSTSAKKQTLVKKRSLFLKAYF